MIELKQLTLKHFWLMFSWANDPKASEMTRDFKKVSLLEHMKWFYGVYQNTSHLVMTIHDSFSNKPVGYAQLIQNFDYAEFRIKIPELKNRNLGYGSQTLDYMMVCAKKMGIKEVHLQVRQDNYAAIGLYRKFGFIQDKNVNLKQHFSGKNVMILTFYKNL
jgi:RimJ/RimL family protein N-acetyltransferase